MKRLKYIVMSLAVALTTTAFFTSCEDEDKARIPELGNGGFVKFVSRPDFWDGLEVVDGTSVTKYDIGGDPASTSFDAITEDPNGNIANYQIFVQGRFAGAPEDPIAYMSTTTFPFDVSFNAGDMESLFNVPAGTIVSGDSFVFTSIITLQDGTVYNSITTSCEDCPVTLVDEDGNPLPPGVWNGGTIDSVLLQGGDTGDNFLLPAIFWTVHLDDF